MTENLPRPLALASERYEAQRARAEIWFQKQARKGLNHEKYDQILRGFVFNLFFTYANRLLEAAAILRMPTGDIRSLLNKQLHGVIDDAFHSKHPDRGVGYQFWLVKFKKDTAAEIRDSTEWRQLQLQLQQHAEDEAANFDQPPDDRPHRTAKAKTGPKPDLENARRVAEIVGGIAPDGNWREKWSEVCEELQNAGVPPPTRWKTRSPKIVGWINCDEAPLAIKAIEYRLKTAKK